MIFAGFIVFLIDTADFPGQNKPHRLLTGCENLWLHGSARSSLRRNSPSSAGNFFTHLFQPAADESDLRCQQRARLSTVPICASVQTSDHCWWRENNGK